MKKLSILCFTFLISILVHSQRVKLGLASESTNYQLTSADQKNDNHYYKAWPVTMKKGDAVVFIMTSKDFTPDLILFTTTGEVIKRCVLQNAADGKEGMLSFLAARDTTIVLGFSSAEENKTGNFIYTYKAPEPEQLSFSEDYSLCDRLNYLINQWQLYWEFIPKKNKKLNPDLLKELSLDFEADQTYVYQTLKEGVPATLKYGYREYLIAAPRGIASFKNVITSAYNTFCQDIQACLDMNIWTIEKEDSSSYYESATHFILKGAVKDQRLNSFTLCITGPAQAFMGKESYEYGVVLAFH